MEKIYKVEIINLNNEKGCKMKKRDNIVFGFGIIFGIIGIASLIIGIQLLIMSGFSSEGFLIAGTLIGLFGAILVGASLTMLKDFLDS